MKNRVLKIAPDETTLADFLFYWTDTKRRSSQDAAMRDKFISVLCKEKSYQSKYTSKEWGRVPCSE